MNDVKPPNEDLTEDALRRQGALWLRARDGCPSPDLLLLTQSEVLEPSVREALTRHLHVCDACARLAADFSALSLDEPDAATEDRVLARVRQGGWSGLDWRIPLAAALLLACGGGAAWWMRTPAPVTSPSVVASAPAPAAPMPAPIVALWAIEPAAVRIPLSSVGVSRSGEAAADASAALVDALAPYQAGHYADAIPRLEAVLRAHPESADAELYLGVACLLADRPGDALTPLERAGILANANRRVEIEWYRAAAEQRMGRADAARTRLHALCLTPGDYCARACAAEQSLK